MNIFLKNINNQKNDKAKNLITARKSLKSSEK